MGSMTVIVGSAANTELGVSTSGTAARAKTRFVVEVASKIGMVCSKTRVQDCHRDTRAREPVAMHLVETYHWQSFRHLPSPTRVEVDPAHSRMRTQNSQALCARPSGDNRRDLELPSDCEMSLTSSDHLASRPRDYVGPCLQSFVAQIELGDNSNPSLASDDL